MIVLSVQSAVEQFLEGEVRAFLANAPNNSCSYGVCSYMTMSSGTEDYFLGTYYFNRGAYHNPLCHVNTCMIKKIMITCDRSFLI